MSFVAEFFCVVAAPEGKDGDWYDENKDLVSRMGKCFGGSTVYMYSIVL